MHGNFNERAKDWDEKRERRERAEKVAVAIREMIPLGGSMRAIECGCGTGLLGFALLPYLAHVAFADNSPGMLAVVEEKITAGGLTNAETLTIDLENAVDLPSGYDLAFSLLTLHHLPDVASALRKMGAMLVPGGMLCIADLDEEDGSFHGHTIDVHLGFGRDRIARELQACGFDSLRFTTPYVIRRKSEDGVVREYPLFLVCARKAG